VLREMPGRAAASARVKAGKAARGRNPQADGRLPLHRAVHSLSAQIQISPARPITNDGNPCRTALNQEANRFRVRFSSRLCIIV